ncbi:hypothetical protein OEZ86_001209 [Tetradesmus obliquus]|nr:hypothetical protein OEZ86_001209 [Tetradesmus obliquus]
MLKRDAATIVVTYAPPPLEQLCCDTCTNFACPPGLSRSNPVVPRNIRPSFPICCNACADFSCGSLKARDPPPELNQGSATLDLCCVTPVLARPAVSVQLAAASCDSAEVEKLLQQLWQQLTAGMAPDMAAQVVVYKQSCQAGSRKLLMLGKRQLVGSSSSYTLNIVITVKDTNTSPDAITAATKALTDALGVGSSLPANATLAQLLLELNGIAGNSTSPVNATQHMLQEVNGAIAALNLSSIFSNATAVEVSSQAIKCDGVPVQAGAAFPTSCSGLAASQTCQGVCDNQQGLLTYVCQEDSGSWKHVGGSCFGGSSGEWRVWI